MMVPRTRTWLTASGVAFLVSGLAVALVRAFIEADTTGMNVWALLFMTDTRAAYFIWSHDEGLAVALGFALIITALPGRKAIPPEEKIP
jgi:hypothetical protein